MADEKGGHRLLLAFYLVVNNVPATSINDVLVVNNDLGKIAARLWGTKG
jgi:hypothetical protein